MRTRNIGTLSVLLTVLPAVPLIVLLLSLPFPAVSQTTPITESPCNMSCRLPGMSASQCGADLHGWHDGQDTCTNWGYVFDPNNQQVTLVVGQGTCNIGWSDGSDFALTCAYGNCEGSGEMYCGGVLYQYSLSCSGGPQGSQSDVARAAAGHDLAECNGFGNGMRARCENGSFTFALWD